LSLRLKRRPAAASSKKATRLGHAGFSPLASSAYVPFAEPIRPARPASEENSAMRAVLDIVLIVLDLCVWLLVIQAILSWLLAFNVVNRANAFVRTVWSFTHAVSEPLLRPIRRHIPSFNGLDLSPLILILLIYLVQRVIVYYIYPNVF
jgi:YggT family protein